MIKLTREQTEEAIRHPQGVPCEGDGTDQTFVIVDSSVLQQMQETIQRIDIAAIQSGIDDMTAGRTQSVEQAYEQGRKELKSRFKK